MNFGALVAETLRDPSTAARHIIAMQLERPVIYEALVLVAAVNALLSGIAEFIFPTPFALPALLSNPLGFFVLVAGGLIITAHLLYWAGRAMGGQGGFSDVLVLLVWLQALRALGQALVLVLGLVLPSIAGLVALAIALLGVWLLLHFVRVSLNLASLWYAAGLLIAVSAGVLIGLMMLITLTGISGMGASYV